MQSSENERLYNVLEKCAAALYKRELANPGETEGSLDDVTRSELFVFAGAVRRDRKRSAGQSSIAPAAADPPLFPFTPDWLLPVLGACTDLCVFDEDLSRSFLGQSGKLITGRSEWERGDGENILYRRREKTLHRWK